LEMDKENGKGTEGNSGSSKVSNPNDPASLLDAASLFGAYWPRGDANSANAANLFAAGGGFGLPPHPSLPFGMLPPTTGRGMPSYPTSTAAAAAYSNAYTNTLSVAASQAASLGIPAASKFTTKRRKKNKHTCTNIYLSPYPFRGIFQYQTVL
jgi:hypothetical protein